MKNIVLKYLITASILGIILSGCEKKLEINPRQSLDATQAFASVNNVEAAINSVYALLKSSSLYGRDQFVIAEALGDLVFSNARGNRFTNENANAPNNHMINWGTAYQAINEANLILDAINNVPGATGAQKLRWEGELKFLRALLYFDVVKAYAYIPTYIVPSQDRGGIVITLTGTNAATPALNYFPSRAPINAVYAQIMSDLYRTAAVLSNANKGVYYASKISALALGSRVALYQGNFQRADSFATAAITGGGIGSLTTTANHVAAWRAVTHTESIFEVRFASAQEAIAIASGLQGAITNFGSVANLGNPSSTANGGFGPLVPNLKLITDVGIVASPAPSATNLGFGTTVIPTLTRSGDVRNQLYEVGPNVSGRWIECTKFLGKSGTPGLDNIPVLRWAELYFNRAEARAKMGGATNELNALADLNVMRTNRITGFVAGTPLTGQALIDEILKQRSLEFAYEGQRYWDLKRNGLPIVKVIPAVNLPATDFRYNARIPLGEVDGNPNMLQNFGY